MNAWQSWSLAVLAMAVGGVAIARAGNAVSDTARYRRSELARSNQIASESCPQETQA